MNDLGNQIRTLRKAQKISQVELAKRTNIDKTALCRYERGNRLPHSEHLQALAEALGVPLSMLTDTMTTMAQDLWLERLKEKLSHLGFSLGCQEGEGVLWVESPTGFLEVTEEELWELNRSADRYLRFLLWQLRSEDPERFRSRT